MRPAFSLNDPRDVDAVVELCRRLNGIPLAVELPWDEVPLAGGRWASFDAAFGEGRALDPRTGAALCRAALGVPVVDAGRVGQVINIALPH